MVYGQKSPPPPYGQAGIYTELTFQYKNEIDISDALFMHCHAVCNGRIFLHINGSVPHCRGPPANLNFLKIQIDWRYITWMLTKKDYGSAVNLSR